MKKLKWLIYGSLLFVPMKAHAFSPIRYVQISTNVLTQQTGSFNVNGGTITNVGYNGSSTTFVGSASTIAVQGNLTLTKTGSAAVPTLQIGSSGNSGIYANGTTVSLVSNGTDNLIFDNSQVTVKLGGSAAAPGFSIGSSGNSGVRSSGATLALVSNAKDNLVWDNSNLTCKVPIIASSGTVGQTGGAVVGSGNIGQVISTNTATYTNFGTSSQYSDLVSTQIAAGDYLVWLYMDVSSNTSTITDCQFGVSTTSGNSGIGLTNGNTAGHFGAAISVVGKAMWGIGPIHITPSAFTTYYFKIFATYSGGTPQASGTMVILRVS